MVGTLRFANPALAPDGAPFALVAVISALAQTNPGFPRDLAVPKSQ
jgi:hypothetical protein